MVAETIILNTARNYSSDSCSASISTIFIYSIVNSKMRSVIADLIIIWLILTPGGH